jgi:hypothetical protein
MAMRAIADERVDVSISHAEVRALLVGTGEALGVDPLGCSPAAFHLTPGTRLPQGQVSYPARGCRRGDRRGSQEGFVA